MAGIPFLSRILALAGIKVKNQSISKEANITVNPLQSAAEIDVELPSISGVLPVVSQVVLASEKGAANGVAELDSTGKVPSSQLPPYAISEVFVVPDEAARLALTAQVGDIAIQTDTDITYILQTEPPSVNSNWVIISATNAVTSVNGQVGPTVTLDAGDVGAVDITGDTMTGPLQLSNSNTSLSGELQILEPSASGNHYVGIKAPILSDFYTLTLPTGHGSVGQVLSTTGPSGVLEWVDNTSADAVLSVNGVLPVAGNVTLVPSDIGAVAKTGDTMTGNLTLGTLGTLSGQTKELRFGELSPDGVVVGPDYVGFKAPDSITTSVIWTLPDADGASGQALVTNASGVLSWQNSVTSVNGSSGAVTVQELVHPTTGSTFERGEANIGMTGVNNTAYGVDAGDALTGGENNTALGSNALSGMTTGSYNVAIGSYALDLVTAGTSNVAIGTYALQNNQGSYNIAIGESANNGGNSSYGIAIGTAATLFGGFYSTLIGYNLTSSHSGAVVIGNDNTGAGNTSNADNEFVLGTSLHEYILSGRVKSVLSLGTASAAGEARFYESDNSSTSYVGLKAASSLTGSTTYTLPTAYPASAGYVLASDLSGNLSWADPTSGAVTSVNGQSGAVTVNDLVHPTGSSTFERGQANPSMTGTDNTAIGIDAADALTVGDNNTALGSNALSDMTNGSFNVAIGSYAAESMPGGNYNVAIGNAAMQGAADADYNIAIGSAAGQNSQSLNGIMIGLGTVIGAVTQSSYSTLIGTYHSADHSGVVIIGNDDTGAGIVSSANNQFILGTSNHKYQMPGKVETALSLSSTDASGQVKFYESTLTYYAGLKASSSLAANVTWTLPTADGTNRQVLITNGSGALSFTSLTTTDVAEGTNLYFTDQRARDAITGAASTIVSSDLTVDRALISNGSGKVAVSSVTSTELGYLSGVTSAIQTQINGKVSTSGDTMTGALSMAPVGTLPGETNEIRFLELAANGSNYVGFKAPNSIASDIIWTLPADNGAAAGYTLTNNGSGVLSWSETIDAAARVRLDALEDSRGVYSGNLQTGDVMDISSLVGVGAVEYPIVQIYKNVAGVYENINVEFSFDSSTKEITFGEIVDGPISVVIHVLALTTPYTTLSI